MNSRKLKGSLCWGASTNPSSTSVVVFIFTSLLLILPSSVLPFKAGYVEPVPGSSVMRRGSPMPTGTSSSSSRAAILQKLTSPRRGGLSLPYDSSMTTAPAPTNYYSQSQSMESHEHDGGTGGDHAPYMRYPTVPSPFSSISSTIPSSDKQHMHQRLQHYQRIQRQGMKPTAPSKVLAKEEPSTLLTSGDGLRYYTTGNEATMSSVDIERYSLETDPYKKQTETSVNSVEASHSPSLSKPSPTARSINMDDKHSDKNKALSPSHSAPSPPIPPTLLPPSYLSLATFRSDGTLEKSSSNILSRIADFWRNLSKDVVHNNYNNRTSSSIPSSAGSNSKNIVDKTDTYTKLGSDEDDRKIDDYDTDDNVSLTNLNNNHSSVHHRDDLQHPRHGVSGEKSESLAGSRLQPNKYISMEDNNSEDSSFIAKQQYLSLDDEEDDVGEADIIGRGKNDPHHIDHEKPQPRHHDSHQQHANSVEDYLTSESSVGYDFDNLSSDTHSFHEDLFHHTTGTITAVIQQDQFHEDLIGSGSRSKDEHAHKSEESARSSASFGISGLGISGPSGGSHSVTKNLGNVKRAESDKIWSLDSHIGRHDLIESAEEEHDFYLGMTIGGFLKRELWTIPLFVLAALNMILIILFEVYVLCRARGQSRRHLFLGQMLLFGLFLCSFLALMFAVHPSIIGCFVGRLGVGITYSLIFSVLMVKCVFLLSLDTGVYLPTSYQGMLLFFAVLVQVAVDTQWVLMYPPFLQTVESGRSILLQCGTSFIQLLYSLAYVGFLVLMVGFLAGRAAYKGVVENYRESVYILITAVVTVPVALSWTVAGWMLQGRHQDACVSFGLVAHSLTIFLIMFMPKGRQLASLDKEAVCFEDQEDQCSGYSPSFFHFKPTAKNYKATLWGDGNLYTTLEPTVSTINPNVFFHRNDFHSGMIY